MFPALNPLPDGKVGVEQLLETSAYFLYQKQAAYAILGGNDKDTQPAEELYDSDLDIILPSLPPAPSGYRTGTFMLCSKELGQRPAVFFMAFPDHCRRIPAPGIIWRFEGLYDVKTNNRYMEFTLDNNRCSEWMERFKSCEGMREWAHANVMFHYLNAAQADVDISKHCVKAGLPSGFFSSTSGRRGHVSEKIGNKILLQNMSLWHASREVSQEIGWSYGSDTVTDYMSPLGEFVVLCCFVIERIDYKLLTLCFVIVRRCVEIRDNGQQANYPNGVASMTLLEKHPSLASIPNYLDAAGNLPGPWRDRRLCSNDGFPDAYMVVADSIWQTVRPAHMAVNYILIGPQAPGGFMNRVYTLATNFWNMFGAFLHPSWDIAVTNLRQAWNGVLVPQYKARGMLLNVLVRNEFLTINMVNAGVFPPVPAHIANYFQLPQFPNNYNPPRRPMGTVRAGPTSNLFLARVHEVQRARRRRSRTIWYHGQSYRLVDLTMAQTRLLMNDDNPPFDNQPNIGWLWAATQP